MNTIASLSAGIRLWAYSAAALAALSLLAALLWYRAEAISAAARLDTLRSAHAATLDTLARVEADQRRTDAAQLAIMAEVKRRAARSAAILEDIRHVETPDGCVGPAVRAALDGLRRPD